jgi:hypothetical protein
MQAKQIFLHFLNTRVYRRRLCKSRTDVHRPIVDALGNDAAKLLGMCDRHHKGNRSECHRSAEYLSSCQC